jgi:hypothetical protein
MFDQFPDEKAQLPISRDLAFAPYPIVVVW